MPIIDGVRVLSRMYAIPEKRRQEITEQWRQVEQHRARQRLEKALKPKLGMPEGPPTREERERFRELAVDLAKRGLFGDDLDDAEVAELERRLWAFVHNPGRMVWGHFIEAVRIERFGSRRAVEEPIGSRKPSRITDGHLHGTGGW